ncbi:hypothetical protein LJY25_14590 [Hymenobacter sp. BT175]|uniref:hypothetical protein n=1 Tax=Hymenobacter translucens TaxID=2886507 RepID=UPI001D0DC152|nr:hypothetical protein [Hymenobacter translucens]MCC2547680.1 hypothetical protein [Hymenobacter translucens]
MYVNTTKPKTRINPAELNYLRQAVAATATGCQCAAIQAVVAYAHLHDGMDLRDEAAYLERELAAADEARRLKIA